MGDYGWDNVQMLKKSKILENNVSYAVTAR